MTGGAALAAVLLAAVPAGTPASTAQDEAAQQAFRAGVDAARQERWGDARVLFEKAYGLSPRPVVLINLAGAQARTGRLTEASRNYHRILDDPSSTETASFRRAAAEVLPALEARIPRVRLKPSGLTASDVIRIDGDVVESTALAAGHPLDPGEHTLVVQHGGLERARVLFSLAERETREIALPLPALAVRHDPQPPAIVAPPKAGAPADTGAAPDAERSWWASPWTWTAVAVVLAAGVVTTFVVVENREHPYSGNLDPGQVSVR